MTAGHIIDVCNFLKKAGGLKRFSATNFYNNRHTLSTICQVISGEASIHFEARLVAHFLAALRLAESVHPIARHCFVVHKLASVDDRFGHAFHVHVENGPAPQVGFIAPEDTVLEFGTAFAPATIVANGPSIVPFVSTESTVDKTGIGFSLMPSVIENGPAVEVGLIAHELAIFKGSTAIPGPAI